MGQDDEDGAQMLQAKQQITFNVINKRKDQLRRWQSSEMNAEPARRMKRPKVQFQDSDIFLSACMSGDEEEVEELLLKGADINTCTVDGLTALHQSVIDSKPEMVRFLCEKGADVNAQDNEGWTPLHAAACCGNVAIVRYLCQHGADLSVVNSDKELALDLAVDEQCREYLEDDYKRQMIDLEACREQELHTMLKDVKLWMSLGEYKDVPHHRTGGTAVHVAAGRGYTQLLELLIKAGGNVRAQDKDGWTPLHAAAHWAERDACKMLLENGAELSDLTYSGVDVLGVADKECVDYLIELADNVKSREKRKSPGGSVPPASILQEKNHRTPSHEEHVLSTQRKIDLQHKDQYSENEFLHSLPSTTSLGSTSSANTSTTTTTIMIGDPQSISRESSKETTEDEEYAVEEELEAEDEEEAEEEEEDEEEIESIKESSPVEVCNGKEPSLSPARSDASRNLSVVRSLDGYSDRSSSVRESSAETSESPSVSASESSRSASVSTSNSSRFVSSTPSSQRSASVHSSETPRSSLRFQENSSVVSGDQTVSATVPIAPLTAPPKAVHQSPSSWINRGFPLVSRGSSSSVTRSSSTPASEIISPPASLHSLHPYTSSCVTVPSSSATASVPSTPVSNVMAATISSSAKNTPSPTGSVTISATFSKPGRWQSKTVTESEAERRNNSRMQRQHRRSTQGVTKEQLEEASKFATDEVARKSAQVMPTYPTLQARLASEEKDLSSASDDLKDGDVTTSATVSLVNSPNSNAANVRRKSQGLSNCRSNRRATGPVNPEDLVQLRPPAEPTSPAMSLRLATASNAQPYSIRSNTGTLPTMTSRFAEKAQSLPPAATNGTSTSQPISSRSAVVAGLSPAPRSGISSLSTATSSRYMPSSSLSSNSSTNPTSTYGLQIRPTETNLNYKALFEKERTECDRLRREIDDMRRSQTNDTWRGNSTTPAWRTRNASPSAQPHNLSVAKSTSFASFDENERRSLERKISDLELQLKTSQNLRMENQRLKEENGALVRVISKMTI
uniref:ANK_REP_REGION domain-containing protein n=1 Tax=Caenorhabditis japonica TaxID=281687 RepID=A0A8R1DEX4_CAEJA